MKINIEENKARKMLEEMGVSQTQIDQFINDLPKTEEEEREQTKIMKKNGLTMAALNKQYDEEYDPFKKSVIIARKISLDLE